MLLCCESFALCSVDKAVTVGVTKDEWTLVERIKYAVVSVVQSIRDEVRNMSVCLLVLIAAGTHC